MLLGVNPFYLLHCLNNWATNSHSYLTLDNKYVSGFLNYFNLYYEIFQEI